MEHIYTHARTPPKTKDADIDCQPINLNTMRFRYREKIPRKEDSLSTYAMMTPEYFGELSTENNNNPNSPFQGHLFMQKSLL